MTFKRIKQSELPEYRKEQAAKQGNRCPITGWFLHTDAVADHCHKSGMHRSILPNHVNAMLGKVENAARRVQRDCNVPEFLRKCAEYIEYHERNPSFVYHHTFKTPEQKRERTNKLARARRAAKKANES